jgi:hypothetical protein
MGVMETTPKIEHKEKTMKLIEDLAERKGIE